MGGLMKIVVFTAPVLAAVFLYVLIRQVEHDARMDRESLHCEREWNAGSGFASPFARKRALDRAEKADAALAEMEERARAARVKSEQALLSLEQAIREAGMKESDNGR